MANKKRNNKVIFLDRDGVINRKPPKGDYVKAVDEFKIFPRAIEAIRRLKEKGYKIYVITSQSAIAQGLMTEDNLHQIHKQLQNELSKYNAEIDGFYYCPHGYHEGCECRKPRPGLIFEAAEQNGVNLDKAVYIGDEERDMKAARAAGCRAILVTEDNDLLDIVNNNIRFK